jgi:copper chaperone CopZ
MDPMLELSVKRMTCGHCVAAVKQAVIETIGDTGYEAGPAEPRKGACG